MAEQRTVIIQVDPSKETVIKPFAEAIAKPGAAPAGTDGITGNLTVTFNGAADGDGSIDP